MKQARPAEPGVALAGVRHASERHTAALCSALAAVADSPATELSAEEKLHFFSSAQAPVSWSLRGRYVAVTWSLRTSYVPVTCQLRASYVTVT
jgi:hypothetical protein